MNKKEKRAIELYEQAVALYLNKTDWDISQWLDDEDLEEYCILQGELDGDNCYCGKHKDRM